MKNTALESVLKNIQDKNNKSSLNGEEGMVQIDDRTYNFIAFITKVDGTPIKTKQNGRMRDLSILVKSYSYPKGKNMSKKQKEFLLKTYKFLNNSEFGNLKPGETKELNKFKITKTITVNGSLKEVSFIIGFGCYVSKQTDMEDVFVSKAS